MEKYIKPLFWVLVSLFVLGMTTVGFVYGLKHAGVFVIYFIAFCVFCPPVWTIVGFYIIDKRAGESA